MRMLKVLTVATLLAAVASAHSSSDSVMSVAAAQVRRAAHVPQIASDKLPTTVLSKHLRELRENTHAAARDMVAQHRDMHAQQLGGCNDASAMERVIQACPTLADLAIGATSFDEFLPTFCGSACFNTVRTEFAANAACLATGSASFLVGFIDECVNRPQCLSAGFISGANTLQTECGQILDDTFNIENTTAAAVANARLGCSGTCVSRQLSFLNTYRACFTSPGSTDPSQMTAMLQGMVGAMCSSHNGELCAVHLKNLGALECRRDRGGSCDQTRCDSSCQPIYSTANLDLACTPCNDRLIPHISTFGDDPTSTAVALDMMCLKLNQSAAVSGTNPYCLPVALTTLNAAGSQSAFSPAMTCAATGAKQCTERVIGLSASADLSEAKHTMLDCIARAQLGSLVASSTSRPTESDCVHTYANVARVAAQTAATGRLLCSQNAAGDYCYTHAVQWAALSTTTCRTCTSACATAVTTELASTGCCAAKINDWLRYNSHRQDTGMPYPASFLPAGTQSGQHALSDSSRNFLIEYRYNFGTQYTRTELTRADQPLAINAACAGNGTALWDQIEGRCPTTLANPPSASFRVTLAWSRVASQPALKRDLEQALSDDAARNANVNPDQIINGTLVEGTGTVQERNATSRRQTTSTTSDCNFRFLIDAADTATAAAAVAAIDEKVTAGALLTPETSAKVLTTCEECLDARSTSLVSASAPAPGAPPSSSSSSACAFMGAFVATVAAVLLV